MLLMTSKCKILRLHTDPALIPGLRNIVIYKGRLEPVGPPFHLRKNGEVNWFLRK